MAVPLLFKVSSSASKTAAESNLIARRFGGSLKELLHKTEK